ncbi:MAG: hypothetical protein EHM67_00065 [Hyphomicrobiaceae bacterium]|nr:MAG: hypothetical protein EHM67_00065 [Hyphomicrobiaceae bacterium]
MPKKSTRPKARYKPGYGKNGQRIVKPEKPKLTQEELAARALQKTEERHDITPHKVATMILKERGLLTQVVRSLKIPRSTLLRYIEKHDVCVEALSHARDAMGDKAEKKLFEAIEAGDVRCILYYLSTVHRHRGYGLNRADMPDDSGNNGRPVFVETVNIVGIPSGTFLPKEIAAQDNMVIDN